MVYVDDMYKTPIGQFGRMKMSHMIADTRAELLEMADKIGLQRKWIQSFDTPREHFDIVSGNGIRQVVSPLIHYLCFMEINDLKRMFVERQERYVYYIIALSVACLAFTVYTTIDKPLSWNQIPLAFAVL